MREVPFGNDGNFSRDRMIAVINSELANNIGNLVQRTLSMIQKNCGGMIPQGKIADSEVGIRGIDFEGIIAMIDSCEFDKYIGEILFYSSQANEYIDKKAPWALKKEGKLEEMGLVLYSLAESIRKIAIILQPLIPKSSSDILDQLMVPEGQRSFRHLSAEFALIPATPLPPPQPVFPRFMEKVA